MDDGAQAGVETGCGLHGFVRVFMTSGLARHTPIVSVLPTKRGDGGLKPLAVET